MADSGAGTTDRVVGVLLHLGLGLVCLVLGFWAMLGIGMSSVDCDPDGCGALFNALIWLVPGALALAYVGVTVWFARRSRRGATVWWVPLVGACVVVAAWLPGMLLADRLLG